MIRGETVVVRRADPSDTDTLFALVRGPGVVEWWPGTDLEEITGAVNGEGDTYGFVVEVAGEPGGEYAGFIQYWEETTPGYRHAGIDIALVPAFQGRGLGADAVRTLARYLFDVVGHHRVVIDPAAHNTRAIRTYEKVGFRRVGVMRHYERGDDGRWHDGLLMDMLRDDLT